MAPEFVRLILGEKWMMIVPFVRILAVNGCFKAMMDLCYPALNASGRPDLYTRWQFRLAVLMACTAYPCIKAWDVMGIALAVLFGTAIAATGLIVSVSRMLSQSLLDLGRRVMPPLGGLLLCVMVLSFFERCNTMSPGWHSLGVLTAAGILSYVIFFLLMEIVAGTTYRMLFREILKALLSRPL